VSNFIAEVPTQLGIAEDILSEPAMGGPQHFSRGFATKQRIQSLVHLNTTFDL
jgi:hypothetical protein